MQAIQINKGWNNHTTDLEQKKNFEVARTWDRTMDLGITSAALYHWAIRAVGARRLVVEVVSGSQV